MPARLLQACVWYIIHCGAQGYAVVYAGRISCNVEIRRVLKALPDGVQLPVRTYQVPFIAGSNPAVCCHRHIARWIGNCRKRQSNGAQKHAATLFFRRRLLGRRQGKVTFLPEAMRLLPCPITDTVNQADEPKACFPLICATAQVFGRKQGMSNCNRILTFRRFYIV